MSDRNQDKEKREKQGDPEHDESVLNPERKDELDLSKKERRLIEKSTIFPFFMPRASIFPGE